MEVVNKSIEEIVKILKKGGVGILPTDTIYGIHCVASNKEAVERVYETRQRDSDKPCIILISDMQQIELFGIGLFDKTKNFFKKIWPGRVSIIIPISREKQEEFEFLHRGEGSLAFRMPDLEIAREIVDQTGPLISTSANLQGQPPAKNIAEAKKYFGDKVDFYFDIGELESVPSTLAEIKDGKINVLRRGEVDLEGVDY